MAIDPSHRHPFGRATHLAGHRLEQPLASARRALSADRLARCAPDVLFDTFRVTSTTRPRVRARLCRRPDRPPRAATRRRGWPPTRYSGVIVRSVLLSNSRTASSVPSRRDTTGVPRLALDGDDGVGAEEARRPVVLILARHAGLAGPVAVDHEDLRVAGVHHLERYARSVRRHGGRGDCVGAPLEEGRLPVDGQRRRPELEPVAGPDQEGQRRPSADSAGAWPSARAALPVDNPRPRTRSGLPRLLRPPRAATGPPPPAIGAWASSGTTTNFPPAATIGAPLNPGSAVSGRGAVDDGGGVQVGGFRVGPLHPDEEDLATVGAPRQGGLQEPAIRQHPLLTRWEWSHDDLRRRGLELRHAALLLGDRLPVRLVGSRQPLQLLAGVDDLRGGGYSQERQTGPVRGEHATGSPDHRDLTPAGRRVDHASLGGRPRPDRKPPSGRSG